MGAPTQHLAGVDSTIDLGVEEVIVRFRHLLTLLTVLFVTQLALAQWVPPQQVSTYATPPTDPWPELLRWFTSTVVGGGVVAALARGALQNEINRAVNHHIETFHNHHRED